MPHSAKRCSTRSVVLGSPGSWDPDLKQIYKAVIRRRDPICSHPDQVRITDRIPSLGLPLVCSLARVLPGDAVSMRPARWAGEAIGNREPGAAYRAKVTKFASRKKLNNAFDTAQRLPDEARLTRCQCRSHRRILLFA